MVGEDLQKFTLLIPRKELDELDAMASRKGLTKSALARLWIMENLETFREKEQQS